jgi:uncharacterized protein (DUF2147 family)
MDADTLAQPAQQPVLQNPQSHMRDNNEIGADIVGLWYTENREGGVEIYPCGAKICGRLHWFGDRAMNDSPGRSPKDIYNVDTDKRQRLLCGMQFMGEFTPEGPGRYIHGWIYSPRTGQSFSAEITLVDHDTLKLHGYVFTPLLGASQTWKRVDDLPACNSEG